MTYLAIIKKFLIWPALAVLIAIGAPLQAIAADAAVSQDTAKISFTFDDGLESAYTKAAPTLAKSGLSGTSYIITGCVGMTNIPNKCRADNDLAYMTWAAISKLQSKYSWEIGSHTVTHPYLASAAPDDGQPNKLTLEQVRQELTQSKANLAAHGFNATSFAPPYGDYSHQVWAEVAKNYQSMRGFWDHNINYWPYNDYLINVMQVQEGVKVAQVKTAIDQAIANRQWLVLVMHEIRDNPSNNPEDYMYGTDELDKIASYVKSKQQAGLIQPIKVSQALVTNSVNLLPNASFNSGFSSGWSTDSPANITIDRSSNGNYPDPAISVKLTGRTDGRQAHLFSPKIGVEAAKTYAIKSFLNVERINSGLIGFYIDEYDVNGAWISGQYKVQENSSYIESLNFSYRPSSTSVKKASLQVIVTGDPSIVAYIDNVQWFPVR